MSLSIALTRAGVGLAQGIGLYLLYLAGDFKTWPATEPLLFAALLVMGVFVPVIVIAGLGNLRARTLWAWAVAAAIVCTGLALHDILREPIAIRGTTSEPRLVPGPLLWLPLAAVLFIAHSLIVAGEADRRPIAGYPRLFDVSWKHGVQIALAGCFVGAFWLLLVLSVALFRLIGIGLLADIVKEPWFAAPATTVTFAYALHVTDARAELVRGVRTLAFTLLAWLLPMMTGLVLAFLLALPFTGLDPLWSTRLATGTLLAVAAALVFLINAAYQDGQAGEALARAVRYARSTAAAILVPLVALAAYGLGLRAQQYGWTPERIIAGAAILVAACYALGYAVAACRRNLDLKGLEPTNIVTAFVVVAVVLALLSPVADPARLAVADQLRRLETGQVTPEKFDYRFLRFRSGRYGKEALKELAARTNGPNAGAIAERAKRAIRQQRSWEALATATRETRAANIAVVHPPGQTLPENFVRQDWTGTTSGLPRCLTRADATCQAILVDLDGDTTVEILLFQAVSASHPTGRLNGRAFRAKPDETWESLGRITNAYCAGVREALTSGQVRLVEPQYKEIDAGGVRLYVNTIQRGCPR